MRIRDLKVTMAKVSALKPYRRNSRTHTPKQIAQIEESIKIFGWTNPILVDAHGTVLAGKGRLAAARGLNINRVPVIRIEDMTDAQRRAYVIADNKLAENAGWDEELLALELQDLLKMKLDFDVTVTGFEMGEIDVVIGNSSDDEDDEADQLPPIDATTPPVTQLGDLWQLDGHRVLCADATKPKSFERLMDDKLAEMIFTDPPYNVPILGHVSSLGSSKHAEFAMASGEMSEAEYIAFLKTTLGLLSAHSLNGAVHFVFMDWRHIHALLTVGMATYSELLNLCVWAKTNGGMGSLYRSQHELVAAFKNGTAAHINNVVLGQYGRNRTNVWTYAGMNSFGPERDEALAMHPTVKPVALVQDAILDCSKRNGIVLDAFVGSGTTLIAAERAGRRGFGIELEPRYVDVAVRRFRNLTGIEPVHVASGLTFQELQEARPPGTRISGSLPVSEEKEGAG